MGERGPKPGEGGRPTQDRVICKTRWRTPSGHTKVKYSSEVEEAERNAQALWVNGQLLFFGKYKFSEEIREW